MNTVVIKSTNRDVVEAAVKSFAKQLRNDHPEIQRVIWFGSWVTGLPSPGSDVDICLILSSSNKRPRDRAVDYLPLGFPVGMDLFAYTVEEFDNLKRNAPGWRSAITSGIDI